MENQTKVILIVAAAIIFLFFVYRKCNEGFEEEAHNEEQNIMIPENIESHAQQESPITKDDIVNGIPQRDYAPPEDQWLQKKFNSRNKAKNGEFKRSSYSGARRGNLGPSNWDDYFDENNNVIANAQTGDNDKFLPVDESGGGLAVFKSKGRATCGSNQNCDPEDLFDVDKYLPQEVNDDWFEVQPEPISVKNRHLINITKPIGINTIGTSLKNSSHDIRAEPAAPRFAVSPWGNSSIEPDTNIKPLM